MQCVWWMFTFPGTADGMFIISSRQWKLWEPRCVSSFHVFGDVDCTQIVLLSKRLQSGPWMVTATKLTRPLCIQERVRWSDLCQIQVLWDFMTDYFRLQIDIQFLQRLALLSQITLKRGFSVSSPRSPKAFVSHFCASIGPCLDDITCCVISAHCFGAVQWTGHSLPEIRGWTSIKPTLGYWLGLNGSQCEQNLSNCLEKGGARGEEWIQALCAASVNRSDVLIAMVSTNAPFKSFR